MVVGAQKNFKGGITAPGTSMWTEMLSSEGSFFFFKLTVQNFSGGAGKANVWCSQSPPSKKDSDTFLNAFCLCCPVICLSRFSHTSYLAITFILFQ